MSLHASINIHGVTADLLDVGEIEPGGTIFVRLGGLYGPACLFFDDLTAVDKFAEALCDATYRIRATA